MNEVRCIKDKPMILTPAKRNQYRLNDWKEYLYNCKGIPECHTLNEDHYKYLLNMERLRDLTDSEHDYLAAYDKIMNGVG